VGVYFFMDDELYNDDMTELFNGMN